MGKVIFLLVISICAAINTAEANQCEDKGRRRGNCCPSYCQDPFMSSPRYNSNGKVFLIPYDKQSRKSLTWFENYGFCKQHCAEMVTIHSDHENKYFLDWAVSVGVGFDDNGLWLGAQFNKNPDWSWINGEKRNYTAAYMSGEFSEGGNTGVHALYDWPSDGYKWRTISVNYQDLITACQRYQKI